MTCTDPLHELHVPLLDLAPLHRRLRADIDAAIARVIDDNDFVLGRAVDEFEAHAAAWLGVRHAIGVASGTDALWLALKASGIGRGDEVILPAFTFLATAEAILHAGATPVFADIDPASMTLDPASAEARITAKTRAIVPVHLFGRMAEMDRIMAIARQHDVAVIEDAAQAFGAGSRQHAGTCGAAGCFSFHPTKPLGGFGDGGMVVTGNDDLARTLRNLRNHGNTPGQRPPAIGCNSRLDSIQAAVLDVKLRHLDEHLAERNGLAANYRQLLAGLPVELPAKSDERHVHAQFTIRLDARDDVRVQLAAAGIATAVHYPAPLYHHPALADPGLPAVSLPATERTCARCLSLPLYEGLAFEQQQYLADVLKRALA